MREIMEPKLSERCTMRLGGPAIAEIILETMADFQKLPDKLRELGGQPLVLGRGSNLLAGDGKLPYVLIRPELKQKLEVWARKGNDLLVRASANVSMKKLLRFCLKNGLSGLEGLVGIPGSAGGATAMNAGSFGTVCGQKIHSVLVWSNGKLTLLNQKDIKYSYRQMQLGDLTPPAVILETIFTLTPQSKNDILRAMNLNFFEKKSRQPLTAFSAGCAFKNPDSGPSAGKLLEMAGFKGQNNGQIYFSEKHANFLINRGKGTAEEAFELLQRAKDKVREMFGINLELEVKIIS